jgi:two-component system cell cycle sensor histidine kinase/response regulator CckA
LKSVADNDSDGVLVTDHSGRVFYANGAYLDLIGASDENDVRPIERVFIGDPDVSEAIYRLLKAAREGRRLQEEVRIATAPGERGRWLRMRVRPLEDDKESARMAVWSIADVTRDRERQENVFQELQHAIDYLDHAPAGFFSVDADGDIVYLNATLATWLDQDLAQVSGVLKLPDVVAGEGAALLKIDGAPGDVKTEVLDLDLRTRSGKPVPVRLFHKVAFGADGMPGPSRTLVLNRATDDGSDPQRAAEVRFMRFFQNTPMAIATVDRSGRVLRSNARFASSLEVKGDDRSILLSVVTDMYRPQLQAAIAKRWKAGARSRRCRPNSRARATAGLTSLCSAWRRRTVRRRSSTRSRRPRSARSRTASTSSRRWNPSASSPAASRTISTTCSPPS